MKDFFNARQRFSIRKFSFGAASVLLGTVFLAQAPVAHATEASSEEKVTTDSSEEDQNSSTTEMSSSAALQSAVQAPATEVKASSEVAEEAPAAEKAPVNKTALSSAIASLEAQLASAHKSSDAQALAAARKALSDAKTVLASETASQEQVDAARTEVSLFVKVVSEASANANAEEKSVKEAEKAKTAPAEKSDLDRKTSEAEVTNLLANNFVQKEAPEKKVPADLTAAVKSAVAANEVEISASKELMARENAAAVEYKEQMARLNSSIEAVYVSLRKAGKDEFDVALADTRDFGTGKVDVNIGAFDSTQFVKDGEDNQGTGKTGSLAPANNDVVIDGKGQQPKTGSAVAEGASSTLAEAAKKTYTVVTGDTEPGYIVYGDQKKGRADVPITKEQYDKIEKEAVLWKGKETASGWKSNNTSTGAGSTYEYLAAEIYGYVYEQGEEVVVTNVSKRFDISQEAKDAGWKVLGILPTNLPNGLKYDSKTDTISGRIQIHIENGVYDNRTLLYVTNEKENKTVRYFLANYAVGWFGWNDTKAPESLVSDAIGTSGEHFSANVQYTDQANTQTNNQAVYNRVEVTTSEDGNITVVRNPVITKAETSIQGTINIPGLNYKDTTGNLEGTADKAGIYTVSVSGKDFEDKPNNEWHQTGQEVRESFTVTIRPNVTVGNVVNGATVVPVKVSEGATQLTLTMPDGKTVEAALEGTSWKVTGGTSTATNVGDTIGTGTDLNIPVEKDSTVVGVDNISAVVAAENVSATLEKDTIDLVSATNEKLKVKFEKESGRWVITSVDGNDVTNVKTQAELEAINGKWAHLEGRSGVGRIKFRTNNADGTYSIRSMEVVTDLPKAEANGSTNGINGYRVWEYTQTFDKDGVVTAVDTKRTDNQSVKTSVVVTFNAITGEWTADDGSKVTAKNNVDRITTTASATDKWERAENGKDYTANRSESEVSLKTSASGKRALVYRDTESWTITTDSGVSGIVNRVSNKARDYASVTNTKPEVSAKDYEENKGASVDLVASTKAAISVNDKEDKANNDKTIIAKVTVVAPDGTSTDFKPEAELTAWEAKKAEYEAAQAALTAAEKAVEDAQKAHKSNQDAYEAKYAEYGEAQAQAEQLKRALDLATTEASQEANLTAEQQAVADARKAEAQKAYDEANAKATNLFMEVASLKDTVRNYANDVTATLPGLQAARDALKAKEVELRQARETLANAVDNALADAKTFALNQTGTYKVTLDVVDQDSNVVLDGATANGTTEGTDTASGTAKVENSSVTYNIVVTDKIKGEDAETEDTQGKEQKKTLDFKFESGTKDKVDATNSTERVYSFADGTTEKTVAGEGKFVIDPQTGEVTFTPEPEFIGTATPVEVKLVATIGTKPDGTPLTTEATANYTPTVTGVAPKPVNDKSINIQGQPQVGQPSFESPKGENGEDLSAQYPIVKSGIVLLDNAGKPVAKDEEMDETWTPAYGYDAEGNEIEVGRYVMNVDVDGNYTSLTFEPTDKSYVGKVKPAQLQGHIEVGEGDNKIQKTTIARYTPEIIPAAPTAENATTEDIQGAKQTGKPEFKAGSVTYTDKNGQEKTENIEINENEAPVFVDENGQPLTVTTNDAGESVFTKEGQGTYTLKADGSVEFQPEAQYIGTADGVYVQRKGTNGVAVQGKYTPTVVPVKPEGTPSTSIHVQGMPQEGTVTFVGGKANVNGTEKAVAIKQGSIRLVVENEDGTLKEVPADETTPAYADGVTNEDGSPKQVGTFKVDPATGVVTFEPTDKTYVGKVKPVTLRAVDENGTPATTTYTPEIVPITPTGTPATTTDIQGAVQKGTPQFTGGTNNDYLTNGQPTTVEIDMDAPAKLINPKTGEPTDNPVVVKGEGTYTIDPKTGEVTFTPEPQFTGVATGVEVERQDKNGTPARATYTPTVVGAKPEATNDATIGAQGAVQHGKPTFKNATIEVEENGAKVTKEVPWAENDKPVLTDAAGKELPLTDGKYVVDGEGTYEVAEDGTVTFTPDSHFTGIAKGVHVKRVDKNGNAAIGKYDPVVVPVNPEANETATVDLQGVTQIGKPEFKGGTVEVNGEKVTVPMDDTVPAKLVDPTSGNEVDEVTVPGQGKYTIAPDGTVTFVPEKTFTGMATKIKVVRQDQNGTKVEGAYLPVVIPIKPTGEDKTSIGPKGEKQEGTPEFRPGRSTANGVTKEVPIDTKVKPTFDDGTTEKEIPGEGFYEIDENGKVTFTPEADFTGQATGVTVKRVDENGTPVTAKYTPYVLAKVETKDKETEGLKGQVQKGSPEFKGDVNPRVPAKLLTKDGELVDSITVPNEGTYTVSPNGEVTFTPVPEYVTPEGGQATGVTVVREDTDGVAVEAKYTPVVKEAKPSAEDATSEGLRGQEQTKDLVFTPGKTTINDEDVTIEFDNKVAPIVKDSKGNVITPDADGKYVVPGEGTYTFDPATGKATFTPEENFLGEEKEKTAGGITIVRTDILGNEATATYTPTVKDTDPTGKEATSKNIKGEEQSGTPTFEGSKVTIEGTEVTVDIDMMYQAKLVDPATGKTIEDPTTPVVVAGEGTYKIDPTTGTVTFTPEAGVKVGKQTGVMVERRDTAGKPVRAKYTPEIVAPVPTALPSETTGKQNMPQESKIILDTKEQPADDTKTVNFDKGEVEVENNGATSKKSVDLDPTTVKLLDEKGAEVEEVVVPGEGKYTFNATKTAIIFTPEENFTGRATGVKVRMYDKNKEVAETTYTPTVTPVKLEATPEISEGKQGEKQSKTPTFTTSDPEVKFTGYTLVDPTDNSEKTTVVVPGEGTYVVDPTTGTVTFTPEAKFTGVAKGITVKATADNKMSTTTTYTPEVKEVTVTPENKVSEGLKGKEQKETPTFTISDESHITSKTYAIEGETSPNTKEVPGEGTYVINPTTGEVTFTPEANFVGRATGITVVQTATLTADKVSEDAEPTTTTIETKATYTPEVKDAKPTAVDKATEGPKGQAQSETPTFEGGKVTINGTEVTVAIDTTVAPVLTDASGNPVPLNANGEYVVPGEGTYVINPTTGLVTFTPEADFVGTASGVHVKRVDELGTPAIAKYTPTVRPETKFVDRNGVPIPGTTTEDGAKEPKPIKGYKLVETKKDEKGNITYIYDVVVTVHKDQSGNIIPGTTVEEGTTPKKNNLPGYVFVETKTLPNGDTEHIYRKVTTVHVDPQGNPIPGTTVEEGTTPKKDNLPGYVFVETKTLPNGDTEHVYRKVTTAYQDTNGQALPGYPMVDGEQPMKDIPGYRFVETRKLPNGDTIHIYEKVSSQPTPSKKVTTSYVDEQGNPLRPMKDGRHEAEDIPGYVLVDKRVDGAGNTIYVYAKLDKQSPEAAKSATSATKELPNTGTESTAGLAALGLAGLLGGLGLASRKKKED